MIGLYSQPSHARPVTKEVRPSGRIAVWPFADKRVADIIDESSQRGQRIPFCSRVEDLQCGSWTVGLRHLKRSDIGTRCPAFGRWIDLVSKNLQGLHTFLRPLLVFARDAGNQHFCDSHECKG